MGASGGCDMDLRCAFVLSPGPEMTLCRCSWVPTLCPSLSPISGCMMCKVWCLIRAAGLTALRTISFSLR